MAYYNTANGVGTHFDGATIINTCMDNVPANLDVPEGGTTDHFWFNNSGSCAFDHSYLYVGYAVPGTASGLYNWMFYYSSTALAILSAPWQVASREYNGEYVYIYTLSGGILVDFVYFKGSTPTIKLIITLPGSSGDIKDIRSEIDPGLHLPFPRKCAP